MYSSVLAPSRKARTPSPALGPSTTAPTPDRAPGKSAGYDFERELKVIMRGFYASPDSFL